MKLDGRIRNNSIKRVLLRFSGDRRGGLTIQTALFFAAFGLVVALIGAPLIDTASTQYAESRSPGIDRMTTSSIGNGNSGGGRYIIRKSVLSAEPQIVCTTKITPACLPDRGK